MKKKKKKIRFHGVHRGCKITSDRLSSRIQSRIDFIYFFTPETRSLSFVLLFSRKILEWPNGGRKSSLMGEGRKTRGKRTKTKGRGGEKGGWQSGRDKAVLGHTGIFRVSTTRSRGINLDNKTLRSCAGAVAALPVRLHRRNNPQMYGKARQSNVKIALENVAATVSNYSRSWNRVAPSLRFPPLRKKGKPLPLSNSGIK